MKNSYIPSENWFIGEVVPIENGKFKYQMDILQGANPKIDIWPLNLRRPTYQIEVYL